MPIFKTIIFYCEVCGEVSSETAETGLYDDPPIYPPNDEKWDYDDLDRLCCPKCLSTTV